MKVGRRFRREQVRQSVILRGEQIHDRVELIELGPGGLVVREAPFVARGGCAEVQIEVGELSYRFSAYVVWMREDGDDFRIGLAFVGMPVRLHRATISAHTPDVIDEIAVAA